MSVEDETGESSLHHLDYLEHLTISDSSAIVDFPLELRLMWCWAEGMSYLYRKVRGHEQVLIERIGKQTRVLSWPDGREVGSLPTDLISCAFHWYCVMACNYVRLVGQMAKEKKLLAESQTEYAKRVIPALMEYRNKIAAHPARLFGPDDKQYRLNSDSERFGSTVYPVYWSREGRFFAGPTVLVEREGEQSCAGKWRWSLTQTHEQLLDRYWRKRGHATFLTDW
jgi:hypothetical protein